MMYVCVCVMMYVCVCVMMYVCVCVMMYVCLWDDCPSEIPHLLLCPPLTLYTLTLKFIFSVLFSVHLLRC